MQMEQTMNIKESSKDTEYGFFFIVYEDGRSLQCCLKERNQDEDERGVNGPIFLNQIDSDDSGFDDGLSYDCNEWVIKEVGHEATLKIILDAAKKAGIEVV
jgi:hypothetical protein